MNDNKLPRYSERDRDHLPEVGPSLHGVREVEIHSITPLNTKIPYYGFIGPEGDGSPQGGAVALSQAQTRHIHAELEKLITAWDNEPRDLVAEVDSILQDARHISSNRASQGYEIETDGATVLVYHHNGRGRDALAVNILARYADTLEKAGYVGPGDSSRPLIGAADHSTYVEAVPPAATSF